MKISFEGGIVILLFVVVIFYANFGGSSYVPYRKDSLFSREYPFEGFEDYPGNVRQAANVGGERVIAEATKGVRSVFEGKGLQGGIYGQVRRIDEVSQLKGSAECVGKSMGYSNSMGGLCISPELKQKLVTRGGNQK